MSVQSQIARISGAVSDALAALTDKGVTVPAGTKVDGLADLIAAIEAGGGAVAGTFIANATEVTIDDVLTPGKTPISAALYEAQTGEWYTSTSHTTVRMILERIELDTDGSRWWRHGISQKANSSTLNNSGGGSAGISTYFNAGISSIGSSMYMNGNTETGRLFARYLIEGRRYIYVLLYEGDVVTK